MFWTNLNAGISTEPDGMFFTYDTLQSGRIRLVADANGGYSELEGSPDMTLEVVSDSSSTRDTLLIKDKYAKAGVDEYWLVDARDSEPRFEIWRLKNAQYVLTAIMNGWLESTVFGRAFKLDQESDPLGHPSFQLLVRQPSLCF